jgi:hypothetical protein
MFLFYSIKKGFANSEVDDIINLMDKEHRIFTVFSLFCVILGWVGFISAITGFFYAPAFILYGILGLVGIIFWIKKYSPFKSPLIPLFQRGRMSFDWIAVFFILFFITIFSIFTTPTIFSGRDQGSISEAAIRLSQSHHLEFSTPASGEFFKIYGPDKALNFPGFYYQESGNLITQFPIPYIAWLAVFYSIFGLAGLIIANAVLFLIFALSLYYLFKIFTNQKYALLSLFLILTSFIFSWIFKFTLSENIALALVWLAILELTLFIKNPQAENYYSLLAVIGLLFFTRIEGALFLLMSLVIIFLTRNTREYITKEKSWQKIILPLMFFALIFILNFEKNFPFYQEMARALSHSKEFTLGTRSFSYETYTLKIFSLYGLLGYSLIGIAGIIYFLKKRNWKILAPLFFVLPSFIYLVDSNISTDHPWMLRRFVFSVFPALIFYSLLLVHKFWQSKKKLSKIAFFVLTISLFLSGLPTYVKYLNFSENKNLYEDLANLSQKFTSNDLVLVDRSASGDGWAMLSGPMNFMFEKNSVYFFNPSDLDKIDTSKFGKIYLITPIENTNFWESSILGNRLSYYQDYSINTTRLDIRNEGTQFPDKINTEVRGKIFEVKP